MVFVIKLQLSFTELEMVLELCPLCGADPERVLCHVKDPVTSRRKCERDSSKLNTPALHLHQRGCNTNK